MVDETVNTQSPEEEYEYEYIELAEGEELPAQKLQPGQPLSEQAPALP